MTTPRKKLWILRSAAIGIALSVSAAFASCKVDGPPRPTCEEISDAGEVPDLGITPYTQVTTDAYAPTALGMDYDYGPQCTDCTQDDDLEIMTIADFEDGFAPAWFNYGEPGIEIEPRQAGEGLSEAGLPNGRGSPPPPYWGLQVATLAERPGGERCGSEYALHMVGGRFASWGGGYVTRLFVTRGQYSGRFCDPTATRDAGVNGIGEPPDEMLDIATGSPIGCKFFASPVAGQASLLGADVSDFDGVAFWARRGPSGQSSLRIALVDSATSEDLALNLEREAYFEAVREGRVDSFSPDEAGAACRRIEGCCARCGEVTFDRFVATDETDPIKPTTEKRCHVPGERLPRYEFIAPDRSRQQEEAWHGWNPILNTTPLAAGIRPRPCGLEPPEPIEGEEYSSCLDEQVRLRNADAGAAADGGAGNTKFDEALCRWGEHVSCWMDFAQQVWDGWKQEFGLCCPVRMDEEDPLELNGDPRYGGKECTPYVFNSDFSSGSYCWNPGDPPLPEQNENRCGEGFESAVVVGTEWKLYTIPWAELRRFTPNKPPIDPRGIWQIAFYFGAGYLDTYVDDVGFYRRRR